MVLQVYLSFIKNLMSALLPLSSVIKHTLDKNLMTIPLMVLRTNHNQGDWNCIFFFWTVLYFSVILKYIKEMDCFILCSCCSLGNVSYLLKGLLFLFSLGSLTISEIILSHCLSQSSIIIKDSSQTGHKLLNYFPSRWLRQVKHTFRFWVSCFPGVIKT